MRVFVSGATGYIGNAVARAFRRGGWEVFGLVRSEAGAEALWRQEIRPVLGALQDDERWAASCAAADVAVHCAVENSKAKGELDRVSIAKMLELLPASGQLLYTSGCWVYGGTAGRAVSETSALNPPAIVAWRPAHEALVLGSERRSLVLRPGCVYGGRGGLTASWFASAKKEGAARVIGDGKNRWAMIHVEDVASAYVLAAERRLDKEILNLADPSGFTVREMAEAASRAAGAEGRVQLAPAEEARTKMNAAFVEALCLDQKLDAEKAKHLLGWRPRFASFVDGAEVYARSAELP